MDTREVQQYLGVTQGGPAPTDRRNPAADTQKVVLGPSLELAGPYGGADSHRPLAVGSLPHEDPEAARQLSAGSVMLRLG